MPEFPDVTVYLEAVHERVCGHALEAVRLNSPFLLRSVDPPLGEAQGRVVTGTRRLGKRIVLELEGDLFVVLHLMIAGRLHWKKPGAKLGGRYNLAAFDFANGALVLTEAGSRRRASLWLVRGEAGLAELDPGGLEVLEASEAEFATRLLSVSHTLKRALTDPRVLSGIGNSYSDEILHAARLSPFRRTSQLRTEELGRLYEACRRILLDWTDRLRKEAAGRFPEKVTAFREGMAVHGRYRQPCPVCSTPVQRIVYAENECNYCPTCQTQGRLLADRALSALLKEDWPKTLEELEARIARSSEGQKGQKGH
ncbi:MAG: formamidopyrimidine-DNA glycosylase [Acidobacteria bacterium]|nr:MAG: formamidopyrimidine-DNA glycosylase [Acidobacteriota bacterium]